MTELADKQRLAISTLGATDAIHAPPRARHGGPVAAELRSNLVAARAEYAGRGIRYGVAVAAGSGGMNRKAVERTISDLAAAGHVRPFARMGRTTHITLTRQGEDSTRALCGLWLLAEAHPLLQSIRDVATGHDGRDHWQGWVREHAVVADAGATVEALTELEGRLAPALCRGFLEAGSDQRGRGWYRLTPAGLVLADKDAPPVTFGGLPEPSEEASDLYAEAFNATIDRLHSEPGTQGPGDLMLPLPEGVCPVEPIGGAA